MPNFELILDYLSMKKWHKYKEILKIALDQIDIRYYGIP